MIYIIKQEGLYQNKVNSLVFTGNCKMGYWHKNKTARKKGIYKNCIKTMLLLFFHCSGLHHITTCPPFLLSYQLNKLAATLWFIDVFNTISLELKSYQSQLLVNWPPGKFPCASSYKGVNDILARFRNFSRICVETCQWIRFPCPQYINTVEALVSDHLGIEKVVVPKVINNS